MKNRVQPGTNDQQPLGPAQTGLVLVWVQCKEYKCLAYKDPTGQWINFYTGQKITDFIRVIE